MIIINFFNTIKSGIPIFYNLYVVCLAFDALANNSLCKDNMFSNSYLKTHHSNDFHISNNIRMFFIKHFIKFHNYYFGLKVLSKLDKTINAQEQCLRD